MSIDKATFQLIVFEITNFLVLAVLQGRLPAHEDVPFFLRKYASTDQDRRLLANVLIIAAIPDHVLLLVNFLQFGFANCHQE